MAFLFKFPGVEYDAGCITRQGSLSGLRLCCDGVLGARWPISWPGDLCNNTADMVVTTMTLIVTLIRIVIQGQYSLLCVKLETGSEYISCPCCRVGSGLAKQLGMLRLCETFAYRTLLWHDSCFCLRFWIRGSACFCLFNSNRPDFVSGFLSMGSSQKLAQDARVWNSGTIR